MDVITFKRGSYSYEWSTAPEFGYIPHINGEALPYIITKCETLKDWGCWSKWGEGKHVCGGLTLKEAKETFTNYITSKLELITNK